MPGRTQRPDVMKDIRRMQEQIRRLQTRDYDASRAWSPIPATCFNNADSYPADWSSSGGWYPSSSLPEGGDFSFDMPRYYVDSGRAWFAGLMVYSAPADDSPAIVVLRNAPEGLSPELLTNSALFADPDNSDGPVPGYHPQTIRDKWWMGEWLPDAEDSEWLNLDPNPNFEGSDDPGTKLNGYPPGGTTLVLDGVSYRIG